jgi:uncharacterized protein YggE
MNFNRLSNMAMVTMIFLVVFLAVEINQVWNTAATTNTVSFSGEGKISAKPDIAIISAGVMTQNADSKTAQDANSQKSKTITDYLKSQGIDEKDIKTSDYNISPQYNYSGGQSTIVGYQVSENFQIKVHDLTKVSTILSGLVRAGANQVNNLGLQIENPDSLKDQARQMAIEDAKKKAQTLQGQVGIKLGHIVNFSENSGVGGPIYYDAKAQGMGGGGGPVPSIETGQNDITVDVTLTYQIK